jgi:transposase
MYDIERGCAPVAAGLDPEQCERLMRRLLPESTNQRRKALSILAHASGFSAREIAHQLGASRNGVRSYLRDFEAGGVDTLFNRKQRARMTDNAVLRDAVFALLHEPPSASGINRTTWKMADLQRILAARGHQAGADTIRSIIRSAGYAWKSAKVVLTSTDFHYEEKLARIRDVLGRLQPDEHFFSIDEFGPFAVKAKPGRLLTAPGVQPSVPQWQKSKGCLILTAALELSANQVTHFYSMAKNTDEMIRMANTLLEQYAGASTLYLSWDAASWHLSKKLTTFIDEHNATAQATHRPLLELAPLPASAQFLNVIESVFSGMARAIIHNSDYESVDAVKGAIDRYFLERNLHFETHPKRAGKAIWGLERTACEFSDANNCKDPAYR